MAKRLLDLIGAALGLLLAAPLLAVAAAGVRLASPGPVLYRARRVGRHGRVFTLFKLRTMRHCGDAAGAAVTSPSDVRVFPWGAWLRRAKLDELPQFINVLRGDMSLVGPRPEDPAIVARYYTPADRETLAVRPGLASVGSLFQYTHGDALLSGPDVERAYSERLLPIKLALERVALRRSSLGYDLAIIGRTAATIAGILCGRRAFGDPPELPAARTLLASRAARSDTHGTSARRAALAAVAAFLVLACDDARWPQLPEDPGPPAVLLVGAGDIASCQWPDDERTAALLDSIPGLVFTTGDNAYPHGGPADFTNCYAAGWGRHRDRTRPAPGNHEYETPGAMGYFAYFGAAAGAADRGYYAYRHGAWLVVVLNSAVDISDTSAQLAWLRAELASETALCALAYWHHPRFSSGTTHGGTSQVAAAWDALYDAGVEVVLNGHEHHYERFAALRPDGAADPTHGIRQFVVGTGGDSDYPFGTPLPTSEVRRSGTPGVLALTLWPDRYEWTFVAAPGDRFTDTGTDACHGPAAAARAREARP